MLFEDHDGHPVARMPRNLDGSPRQPDGRKLLSIDQAAERFARSMDALRDLFASTFEQFAGAVPSPAAPGEGEDRGEGPAAPAEVMERAVSRARDDVLRVVQFPNLT